MSIKTSSKIVIGALAVVAVIGGFLILNTLESSKAIQTTDDAYVRADLTVVVPQVAGLVAGVLIKDNQHVEAGAPLVQIDDRELQIRLADTKATINSLKAQLTRQQSIIVQAQATLKASAANLELAESNRQRFANLAQDGSGSVQAAQQAEKEWATQTAAVTRDQAGLQAAEQQVAILKAELEKAAAQKDDAELKVSYSRITAPVTGVVSQRSARTGAYVRVGEPLLTIVPLENIYIEANFRETQLANVNVGQPVDITVDALPGVQLRGRVESLGAASGSSFSLVPAHNATGNFTKITQRLPVRIELAPNQTNASRLRVGMSVTPSIHTDATTDNQDAAQVPAKS